MFKLLVKRWDITITKNTDSITAFGSQKLSRIKARGKFLRRPPALHKRLPASSSCSRSKHWLQRLRAVPCYSATSNWQWIFNSPRWIIMHDSLRCMSFHIYVSICQLLSRSPLKTHHATNESTSWALFNQAVWTDAFFITFKMENVS